MPDTFSDTFRAQPATAERPLGGLTVLVVEDSRFASEALRLLCLRSGARIRRADCLHSAHRHLLVYRPSVAIVDLGLPDGPGIDLIAELDRARPRTPVILAISGAAELEEAALAAGADAFIAKPIESLGAFQEAILSRLPEELRPRGLRPVSLEQIAPDALALREDLTHVEALLAQKTGDLGYVAGLLTGIARTAHDAKLLEAAERLSRRLGAGDDTKEALGTLRGVIREKISQVAVV